MKKQPIRILAGCLILSVFSSVVLTACGNKAGENKSNNESGKTGNAVFTSPLNENETAYTFAKTETYKNNLELDGQWGSGLYTGAGSYGIGDPYVMRYDGKYYLYPSSAEKNGTEQGVKVFESEDLIHWTYKGFAATGNEVEGAYAPEVVYYNGTFYMTESQAGKGHYILKSDSPTGPFTCITKNFGRNIDGSFWVSDNGKLFFLYPADSVIKVAEIDPKTMLPGVETSLTATLNGWTEGPGMYRRGNALFLTYTGNNVISDGYRVGYSYQIGENQDPQGQYIMPDNNIVILHTGTGNFRGLGHSSNVTGPDLDSWYTAYHNLISTAGPQRRLMIDKYCTNGGILLTNGPTFSEVSVPERPDFEARPETNKDAFTTASLNSQTALVSSKASEKVFTAEYNFTVKDASAQVRFLFGYTDEKNYSGVLLDAKTGTLTLFKTVNGTETSLGTAKTGIPALNAIHTLRVENGSDKTTVSFDSMQKITAKSAGIPAGKIGYAATTKGAVSYSYTAFSNDAFGTSDFETVKNIPSSFSAVQYLKGENRGFSLAKAAVKTDGIRQGEKENTKYLESEGSSALIMDTPNDWVKYALNVTGTAPSFYGLAASISKDSAGAEFQVILDSSEIFKFTVPSAGETDADYVKLLLGQIPIKAGQHTMKIRLISGKLDIRTFDLFESNPTKLDYENKMDQINELGWSYLGNWKIKDGAHTTKSGDTAYAYTGTEKLTNFAVEVEVAVQDEDSIYDGGLLLRSKNQSIGQAQVAESLQGYYLSIRNDQIVLNKYNYGGEALDLVQVSFAKGEYHRLRAEMINNCIKIYVDDLDTPKIIYYDDDAFLSGQIALCSNKLGMSFKNLHIESIKK